MKYIIIGFFSCLAVASFVFAGILYFVKEAIVSYDLLKAGWVRTEEGLWLHPTKTKFAKLSIGDAEKAENFYVNTAKNYRNAA